MYKVQEQCKNVPMYKVQEQCKNVPMYKVQVQCKNVPMFKVQEQCTKCVREPSNLLMLGRGGLSQLPPDIVSGKLIV